VAGWWLTARFAAETPRLSERGVDLPGQVTSIITLTGLTGATIEAGTAGFRAPLVIGGYALALAAGVSFALIERARDRPMQPPRLFRSAAFRTTMVIGMLNNVVFYGLIFALSLFLQHQRGLSPLSAGLAFLPATAAIMASNVIAARAISALGARRVIAAGALAMGLGCLGMYGLVASLVGLSVALAVTGFGIGLIAVPLTSALLGSVEPSRSGTASGALTAFRQTGSVLGVAVSGSLLASQGDVVGLHEALLSAAGLMLVVVTLSFRLT